MTKTFPDTMAFSGFDAPMRVEADIFDLEVEGEIPAEINGTWYRMTPDPQFPPRLGDDFYISGDGMISSFRFENGHVDFKSRYVMTDRLKADRKARRSLFGAYRNPYTDDPTVKGVNRTVANTTPLWHGGRLLALKEDGRPYELDPDTLETKGAWDWEGKLRSETVTAHPKIDPETGELIFFGYEAGGLASKQIAYCVADASGKLVKEEWFEAPYAAMVHDFGVTKTHAIFPIFPTMVDAERVKAGGPHWMSDMSKPSYVGIMPRDGTAKDMRWFERRPGYSFHTLNSWSEGDLIHHDLVLSEINPFPIVPDVSGAPFDPQKAAPFPTRWTFDLSRNEATIKEEVIGEYPGDVPRIDDRRSCLPYRYAYYGMVDVKRPIEKGAITGGAFNLVGRLDVKTKESDTWYPGEHASFGEPQFIPAGPGEDDGYVVAAIGRHAENRSDLGIFDAKRISAGPIAVIRLPLRLRAGVHGSWVPQEARR